MTTTLVAINYPEWKAVHFPATQHSSLDISGQFADPDGDGRTNLFEFAFGTDPMVQDVSGVYQTFVDSSGRLALEYPRWSSNAGILYIPQVSGNLLTGWQAGPGYVESMGATSIGGDRDVVLVRDVLTMAQAPRRFIRLWVDNDADGDGLPDSWELLHGLSPVYAGDGVADFDGDGRSNYQEMLDGTDPLTADNPTPVNGPPSAPANVQMHENPDGSVHVWWEDTSDNETYFVIRKRMPDGTLQEVGRVGPGKTHFYLPPPQ